MSNIGCVIFDMDGVIFDSERACLDTWSEIAAEYGMPDIHDVFYRCIGTNKAQTRQIVEDAYAGIYGEGISDKLLAESSRLFHEKYDGGRLPVKSGVKEILEYLKGEGIRCAVASSTRKAAAQAELGDAGFAGYFEEIIGGDAVKISKPDPEIFLLACDALGVKPEDAVGLEDSFNGVRACKASGLYTVMVPDIIRPDDEMRELADVILPSLKEVQDFLNLK